MLVNLVHEDDRWSGKCWKVVPSQTNLIYGGLYGDLAICIGNYERVEFDNFDYTFLYVHIVYVEGPSQSIVGDGYEDSLDEGSSYMSNLTKN